MTSFHGEIDLTQTFNTEVIILDLATGKHRNCNIGMQRLLVILWTDFKYAYQTPEDYFLCQENGDIQFKDLHKHKYIFDKFNIKREIKIEHSFEGWYGVPDLNSFEEKGIIINAKAIY